LKGSVGNSSLHLRVQRKEDVEEARRIVHRVLNVQSAVSSEAGRITAPMAEADRVTDLLIALRQADIPLAEMSVQKPTLDEVFLTITGHGADSPVEADESKKREVVTL